jgi:hypothetical protein
VPRVELLWWEECPSWERATELVKAEMEALGLDPGDLVVTEVRTDDAAQRRRFVGSPTVLVDGADIQPPAEDPVGLTCRVYRHRDGRVSPLPDREDVRDALATALEGESQ